MAKQDIDVRKLIEAAPAAVWELLDDSATWPRWTPIESHKEIEPPGLDGLGEVRSFRTGNVRVREKIVDREVDRRLVYELIEGMAVKEYRAEIEVEPAPEGTALRWHTTFSPKFPGTGWIYRSALRRATRNFVDGLAEYAVSRDS